MPRRGLALLVAVLTLVPAAGAGAARSRPPRLIELRCVPVHTARCANGPAVAVGRQVMLRGRRLYRGMRVTFRWPKGAIATTLRRTHIGWNVRVPARVRTGNVWVYVRDRRFQRSRARRLRVLPAAPKAATDVPLPAGALPAPFQGGGSWIWYVSRSEGGDPAAIGARARAAGISTVFVKSADGTNVWSQFTPELVAALHAQGLRVCAWQYIYGSSPVGEARAAAVGVADGADCLVLDPETEYQGRYGPAQRYVNALRAEIGESFPVALASFPYVDYHPSLPYSVFLAPGAAQVNAPQVYWKTIGGGVTTVSAHTYMSNRIYGAPFAPLGQSYDSPSAADITRFRQLWAAYGAGGISWWSWQSTASATWSQLGGPLAGGPPVSDPGWPSLRLKAKGDQVIWLQQHLASQDAGVEVDGMFGAATDTALRNLQAARGLPVTGVTDAATWQAVLALPIRAVDWTIHGPASARTARAARAPEIPVMGRGGQPSSTSRTP